MLWTWLTGLAVPRPRCLIKEVSLCHSCMRRCHWPYVLMAWTFDTVPFGPTSSTLLNHSLRSVRYSATPFPNFNGRSFVPDQVYLSIDRKPLGKRPKAMIQGGTPVLSLGNCLSSQGMHARWVCHGLGCSSATSKLCI